MVIRDITDRKHAEEKFAKAFLCSPEAMVISGIEDGRLIDFNESFLRLSGFTRAELTGRSSDEMGFWVNPKERLQFAAQLRRQGEVQEIEMRFVNKSGDQRILQISAHTIDLGRVDCFIATLRDITERKALEQQLREVQKMEAVGRLAGGVAHDFNNLLVGILGYSELLQKKLPRGGELERMAEEIQSAAMRARDLTSRLLALSRRQVLHPRVIDFNALVQQSASLAWSHAGGRHSSGAAARSEDRKREGRSRAARAGGAEPGDQRARRHAARAALSRSRVATFRWTRPWHAGMPGCCRDRTCGCGWRTRVAA